MTDLRNKLVVFATATIFLLGITLIVISSTFDAANSWQPILRSLGLFLSVTILLGFLYRVTVREYDDSAFEKRLLAVLDRKIDQTIRKSVHYGLDGFVDSIEFDAIFDSLRLGDTLWWLDTYDPRHHAWLENLENAIRRGASAKFLVMKANCLLAEMRANELGDQFTVSRFRKDLAAFNESLSICRNNTRDSPGSIEIAEYDDLPCAPLYVIERDGAAVEGYSSLFLGKPTGIRFPHLRWRASEGHYLQHIHAYIVQKWERHFAEKSEQRKEILHEI